MAIRRKASSQGLDNQLESRISFITPHSFALPANSCQQVNVIDANSLRKIYEKQSLKERNSVNPPAQAPGELVGDKMETTKASLQLSWCVGKP